MNQSLEDGLMQDDFPLTLHHMRRRMRRCHPAAEVVTLTDRGAERAPASARSSSASTGSRARSVRSASRAASGSARSPGTPSATSSSTSRSPASARSCTPSTCACSPSRSPTSSTTPRTVWSSSTTRWCRARAARPELDACAHFVVMGDGDGGAARTLRYEDLLARRRPGRLRLPAARRARGRRALLHERHDRQPQGRPLLAPLDHPALDRRR